MEKDRIFHWKSVRESAVYSGEFTRPKAKKNGSLLKGLLALVLISCISIFHLSCNELKRESTEQKRPQSLSQLGITMVPVPSGSFRMGSRISPKELVEKYGDKEINYKFERPVHTVTITGLEMSSTEITVEQYREYVQSTGYRTDAERVGGAYIWTGQKWEMKSDANWKNPYIDQTAKHPVVCVSMNDARSFCKWLSEQTGQTISLPTEAEWEYACRAGTETLYNTGNSESDCAQAGWYGENSDSKTHTVGRKTPNAWGQYDMHGNVWEWCNSLSGYYTSEGVKYPTGDVSNFLHVIRGGSWIFHAGYCRSAYRSTYPPDYSSNDLGFRVVRRL